LGTTGEKYPKEPAEPERGMGASEQAPQNSAGGTQRRGYTIVEMAKRGASGEKKSQILRKRGSSETSHPLKAGVLTCAEGIRKRKKSRSDWKASSSTGVDRRPSYQKHQRRDTPRRHPEVTAKRERWPLVQNKGAIPDSEEPRGVRGGDASSGRGATASLPGEKKKEITGFLGLTRIEGEETVAGIEEGDRRRGKKKKKAFAVRVGEKMEKTCY